MGYHLRPIETKGVFGETSKIREELEELEEALERLDGYYAQINKNPKQKSLPVVSQTNKEVQ